MAINLQKGQRVNMSLTKVAVGLGWKPAIAGKEADLDASVFMIGSNGKLPKDEFFVFYNNLNSPDGSVQHTGDVLEASGGNDDDDEETTTRFRRQYECRRRLHILVLISSVLLLLLLSVPFLKLLPREDGKCCCC